MMDKVLKTIVNKLATRRGERPGDWGAQARSKREVADWLAQKGWSCSVRTIEDWISGRYQPNPAARVLLNLLAEELTKETKK